VLVVLPCCGFSHALRSITPVLGTSGYSPRAFAMISSATLLGTWAYESNCME